jgi:glycosyltransferase involved in cell wall biosynthesis
MPGQAQQLVDGLRAESIEALRIPVNLCWRGLIGRLDDIRIVRSFARFPVFLARLIVGAARADVLHIMAASGLYFYLFSFPALLVARLFGCRAILNYRGGAARSFFRKHRLAVRPAVALAHAVVVPSAFLVAVFREELGIEPIIVPNVCDLARFEGGARETFEPVFIVARHLEPIYNVACVIRAFVDIRRALPDATLHVLGGGSEETTLRQLAEREGAAASIVFHGYVDHSRVPELYRRASVFLNGSNVDNTPNAILEAFAAGLPVITTAAGGIPYLVEHGRTGLLVPLDDAPAMAREALRLIANQPLAATLARNGRELVSRSAWPNVFRLLRSIYSPATAQAAATAQGSRGLSS